MEIDYKHALPEADARARLERLGTYLTSKHGIKVDWTGPKAKFNGKYLVVKIDGELAVAPGVVTFRGVDPGFLWRKKATEYIQGKLEKYLDPKVPLSELPTEG
ncbi:MAG TPA: polyhydroxyalkanoic acid system family protein [Kofleriaceae bacterium]|nr:polyhydroxyalkanoic acid system family protein [Kofleriaceae bacterium]